MPSMREYLDLHADQVQERLESADPLIETEIPEGPHYRLYRVEESTIVGEHLFLHTTQLPGEPEELSLGGVAQTHRESHGNYGFIECEAWSGTSHISGLVGAENEERFNDAVQAVVAGRFSENGLQATQNIPDFDSMEVVDGHIFVPVPKESFEESLRNKVLGYAGEETGFPESEFGDLQTLTCRSLENHAQGIVEEATNDSGADPEAVIGEDWFGVTLECDFTDWRVDALRIARETTLSDGQAVVWGLHKYGFGTKKIAELTDRALSNVSSAVKKAGEKIVWAQKTAELAHGIEGQPPGSSGTERARPEVEYAIEESKWEQFKHPTTGFFACPECEADMGAWEGSFKDGGFVDPSPELFHSEIIDPPRQQLRVTRVDCQNCGYVDDEKPNHGPARNTCKGPFLNEWKRRHGDVPEPDPSDHPEPPV